jgi:hypothetical protein
VKKIHAPVRILPVFVAAGLSLLSLVSASLAQTAPDMDDAIKRIREEGMNHSQYMKTLSYLTDVIGPRLTGSPNLKHANEWTKETLTSFGLSNAKLEAWGPFGRGWALKRFSAEVVEPYAFPLIAAPKAWSPGMKKAVSSADVIYIDARTEADLEKYKGKLKGAVVLISPVRNVPLRFEPLATRQTDESLERMANSTSAGGRGGAPRGGGRRGGGAGTNATTNATTNAVAAGGGGGRRGGAGGGFGGANLQGRILAMCLAEGAVLTLSPSTTGDAGTIFVSQAALPAAAPQGTNAANRRGAGAARGAAATTNAPAGGRRGGPTYYSLDAPPMPPQVAVAVEDYNRLIRMVQQGAKVKIAANLETEYFTKDPMAYNTTAEIPGTDLKDEIVMVGGHMDSWQSGTGATDNGAGVACSMEAVRIIKALDLKPRRTIRIGLWTGEEQGLMGSAAYVRQHFGYYTNNGDGRQLVKLPEYDKFSSYFNLDNGTGKIRGIYLQGNPGPREIFAKWLEPFSDLDAKTVTINNTGGTDHQSFDGINLPGFQFIQDTLDYNTRTHHSNEDVFDRIQAGDMKQASTIMAAFAYQAAMRDEKIPRKPTE